MQSLTIGNLKIKNPLFLAPMLDITSLPYRILCRKAGAGMAYTEMINVPAILHENKKTKIMMKLANEDKPLGIQLTDNNAENFSKAIPFLKKYDLVDINCGCPSDKIISNQCGSSLLKSSNKIAEIIRILKSHNLIVTAKVRLGFNKINIMETSKAIEKAGADAITIHARLANQGYDIPADWKWIEKAKRNLSIPVIGNGDINSGEKAKQMLEIADGAMIGRAAIGNPLIFRQITDHLKTGKEKEVPAKERINLYLKYLSLSKKYKTENIAQTKYLGANFIKGFEGASFFRDRLMKMHKTDEIRRFITKSIIKTL